MPANAKAKGAMHPSTPLPKPKGSVASQTSSSSYAANLEDDLAMDLEEAMDVAMVAAGAEEAKDPHKSRSARAGSAAVAAVDGKDPST